MTLTAAERRARIRARLKDAEEPAGTVEETTNTFTEDQPEPEPVTEEHTVTQKHSISPPGLPNAATSRRGTKPPNYKLHVLTALALAVAIRVSKYGSKALTG